MESRFFATYPKAEARLAYTLRSRGDLPVSNMAIWQYRLTMIPEAALLSQYAVLPLTIPMELAENFPWWSGVQPAFGFEQHIALILPAATSWSTSMRMWGHEETDDAYVCYEDESKATVEEVSFRIDARTISPALVREICTLARELRCVLMTSEYEILAPDESMVLTNLKHSTAKKFVEDPISTLQGLDQKKIQERANYITKSSKADPPR